MIEVMLSLVLVGTSALAGLSAMMFAYRVADANLRALGALSAARAVAEQMATLDFDTLAGNTLPVDIPTSATGTLTKNTWNVRREDIHGTPTKISDDLVLSIRPEVVQSNDRTLFSCSQIIVRFRWEENAFFATRTREESLTLVLSKINSY